jgi:hypothetical protein
LAAGICLSKICPSAAALFRRLSADDVPRLRSVAAWSRLAPRATRALAVSGWRLEELDLHSNTRLGAAGLAALVAAATFAIRRLGLTECDLDAAALLALAVSPWPLEELDLSYNDFSAAAAARALAELSRHRCLHSLDVGHCHLTMAGVDALIEACWPVRIFLKTSPGVHRITVDATPPPSLTFARSRSSCCEGWGTRATEVHRNIDAVALGL